MAEGSKSKHGGARKYGRNKTKCERYRAAKTAERNKAKRIFKSNGATAYKAYCIKTGIKNYLA
jgi:hypothetical protein